MHFLIAFLFLQASAEPHSTFKEPPPQAPDFRQWADARTWKSAESDEQMLFRVPPHTAMREYLDSRGICYLNDQDCVVAFLYQVTIDAQRPEEATLAVMQYLFAGPRGLTQGIGWVTMGMTDYRCLIQDGDDWLELSSGARFRPAVFSIVGTRIVEAVRRLAEHDP